jgi:hypothetical protein
VTLRVLLTRLIRVVGTASEGFMSEAPFLATNRLIGNLIHLPRATGRVTQGVMSRHLGFSIRKYQDIENGRFDGPIPSNDLIRVLTALNFSPLVKETILSVNASGIATTASLGGPDETLKKSLGTLRHPATILSRRWDILYWNKAASLVFEGIDEYDCENKNMIRIIFTIPSVKEAHLNWDSYAEDLVGHFRLTWLPNAHDPRFIDLVEKLLNASEDFRKLWRKDHIHWKPTNTYELRHSQKGVMIFERTATIDQSGNVVSLFFPSDRENTTRKMAELMAGA